VIIYNEIIHYNLNQLSAFLEWNYDNMLYIPEAFDWSIISYQDLILEYWQNIINTKIV